MKKLDFLEKLRDKLSGLPSDEVDGRIEFYSEMIDDRIDEGISEEQAIIDLGPIEDIVSQILSEIPLRKIVKEKIKQQQRPGIPQIVLIALGFPVWFPLLISAVAVAFSIFASICAVVISLWAVDIALAASLLGGIGCLIISLFTGEITIGFVFLGVGIVCAALSIFLFFGCKAATEGCIWFAKKTVLSVKRLFIKKEI